MKDYKMGKRERWWSCLEYLPKKFFKQIEWKNGETSYNSFC